MATPSVVRQTESDTVTDHESDTESSNICSICLDNIGDIRNNHLWHNPTSETRHTDAICDECATRLIANNSPCPFCRDPPSHARLSVCNIPNFITNYNINNLRIAMTICNHTRTANRYNEVIPHDIEETVRRAVGRNR